MKNLLFSIVFIFFSSIVFSQMIEDISLKSIEKEYLIIAIQGNTRKGYSINIDYGQKIKGSFDSKVRMLVDENNEIIRFKSDADIFNFMYEQGYEISKNYLDGSINFFILRRIKNG